MTPNEALEQIRTEVWGTEQPQTFEGTTHQLRRIAKILYELDQSRGEPVSDRVVSVLSLDERGAIAALIENEMADGSSRFGRTADSMVRLDDLLALFDDDDD